MVPVTIPKRPPRTAPSTICNLKQVLKEEEKQQLNGTYFANGTFDFLGFVVRGSHGALIVMKIGSEAIIMFVAKTKKKKLLMLI
jgi:hypothetical protein